MPSALRIISTTIPISAAITSSAAPQTGSAKDFFRKTILPVASAALLYYIFRSACVKNGELDYLWLWILCGLPFGIWRLRLWIIPGGGSLGTGIALFALNFILAGFIGGFVLAWRLLVAAWYVPLTLYRLLTAGCACIITED